MQRAERDVHLGCFGAMLNLDYKKRDKVWIPNLGDKILIRYWARISGGNAVIGTLRSLRLEKIPDSS